MKATKAGPARATPNKTDTLTVRDIMSNDVQAVDPEVTLRDAVELLAGRHITGAPVVAAGRVVGVISASDILSFEADTPGVPTEQPVAAEEEELEEPGEEDWEKEVEPAGTYFSELWTDAGAEVSERFEELKGPEWDLLQEHSVSEAMSRGVRWVSPGTSVPVAAAYMLKHRIHRAIVLERGKLVGIVTATDIMRAVADRQLKG